MDTISVDGLGLPTSIGTSVPSTLIAQNPDQTQNTGLLSTLEGWFDKSVDAVGTAAGEVYEGGKTVLGDVYTGGKTVAGDIVGGVENVTSFGTTQVILLVLAVGVGLYIVGKGQLLKGLSLSL